MSVRKATYESIRAVGGNPTDEAWDWLVNRGPHGSQFTWSQTRQQPPGYVGIEHLQRVIAELEPAFREQLRVAVATALAASDIELLRRAIQVAAAVGGQEELPQIHSLTTYPDARVAADAKASGFYLKRRLSAIDA